MKVCAWFPYMISAGETAGGKRLRIVSRHFSHPGIGDNGTRYYAPFKWKNPQSFEDGYLGGFCSRSGAWFPGHMLVTVDGKLYGLPFAPKGWVTTPKNTDHNE